MKKRFTNSGTSTTKNETSTRKLTLARETLRSLSASELARVQGGDGDGVGESYDSCYPTCTTKT